MLNWDKTINHSKEKISMRIVQREMFGTFSITFSISFVSQMTKALEKLLRFDMYE